MSEVSVVIPTKNRKEFLLRAARSALAQTFAPKEVIVVDDGSEDGTPEAVRDLGDPRVILLSSSAPGTAHARNTGIEAARGDLIAFLDDDDEWLPEKLEKQVPLLESGRPPALVFADAIVEPVAEPRGRTIFSRQPPSCGRIFQSLLLDNFIPTSAVIVRKKIFETGLRFDQRFFPAEDYDLWLKISHLGRCTFSPMPLAVYHVHPGQSGNDLRLMFSSCVNAIEANLHGKGLSVREVPGLGKRIRHLNYFRENPRG